jgi:hypothetical protein
VQFKSHRRPTKETWVCELKPYKPNTIEPTNEREQSEVQEHEGKE